MDHSLTFLFLFCWFVGWLFFILFWEVLCVLFVCLWVVVVVFIVSCGGVYVDILELSLFYVFSITKPVGNNLDTGM